MISNEINRLQAPTACPTCGCPVACEEVATQGMARCPACGNLREVYAQILEEPPARPVPDGLKRWAVDWTCRWCGARNITFGHGDQDPIRLTCRRKDNGCPMPDRYLALSVWQSFVMQEV
jgi:hypothetical protein